MTDKEKEFREFGAQAAAVTVAALREFGALAFVAASFREAKKENVGEEFEGKFLEGLFDAFRLGMEGVRTQQEMSSYLHKIVILIKNRIGEILSRQEGRPRQGEESHYQAVGQAGRADRPGHAGHGRYVRRPAGYCGQELGRGRGSEHEGPGGVMSRKLKPYKVGVAHSYRLSRHVDIYLDRELKDFFGTVDGTVIRGASANECESKIVQVLNNHQELVWHPEIWVTVADYTFQHGGPHEWHEAQLQFNFHRLEICKALDGKTDLERPWLDRGKEFGEPEPQPWEIEKRRLGQDISTVYGHRDRSTFRLPYSDEAWKGLMLLHGAVTLSKKRLQELLRTDGEKFLKNIKPNTLLLSAPQRLEK